MSVLLVLLAVCQSLVHCVPVMPPVQGLSQDAQVATNYFPDDSSHNNQGHIFSSHSMPSEHIDAKVAKKQEHLPYISGAVHTHFSSVEQPPQNIGHHKPLKTGHPTGRARNTKGALLSNATPSGSQPLQRNHKVPRMHENSKNAINSRKHHADSASRSPSAESKKLQFQQAVATLDRISDSESNKLISILDRSHQTGEIVNPPTLQLAVKSDYEDNRSEGFQDKAMLVTVGASMVVMFSLGIVVGVFCCCKKKPRSDENENAEKMEEKALMEKTAQETKPPEETKKASEVINTSDIPSGEKDLDDPVSVKDKIKAFDNKLIIGPSPDHVAKRHSQLQPSPKPAKRTSQLEPGPASTEKRWSQLDVSPGSKRKSQQEMNLMENKVFSNMANKNKTEEEEEEVVKSKESKESKSKSLADNISKSDTQDDISDKIFDNLSTHSNLSQPHNPDVVIASDEEDDEFAALQRGTVILKSFQRAKPPRNRSPATRTSKGRIRKSRPNLHDENTMSKSLTLSTSQDLSSGVKGQLSTPSTTSLPLVSGSNLEIVDREQISAGPTIEKSTEDLCPRNGRRGGSPDIVQKSKNECLMTKSCDFIDFDSVMTQSVTSVSSDVGVMPRKFKKNNDSPKQDRTESPARMGKADKRSESPSRYKKSTDSPVGRRKHRRRDRERVSESSNGRGGVGGPEVNTTDSPEERVEKEAASNNRLSGLPANAANNIFYLIDPTVKNKCKSVGDVAADKRKSGDYTKGHSKASKHKVKDEPDKSAEEKQKEEEEEAGSPVKRERTMSDPSRRSSTDEINL